MIALLALLALWQGTAAQPARPDIVLCIADDVADSDVDAVIARGWAPTLEALAARGTRFRRAYAHAWCAPTRDSLTFSVWTGRFQGDACAPPDPASVRPLDALALAEVFAGQGYHTLHVGKWHQGPPPLGDWKLGPELRGFDSVRYAHPIGDACGNVRVDDGVESPRSGDDTQACLEEFLDWWTATPAPRFAVVNFAAGHAPFRRPSPAVLPPGFPQCPAFSCSNRDAYEMELAGFDFALGQIVGLASSAFIVVTADNGTPGFVPGEPLSETSAARPDQDPYRLKLTCYEDGVRVPLIVAGPGIGPSVSRSLVHVGTDMMPTLARLANIQPRISGVVLGRSFAPCFAGLPGQRSMVFVWSPPRVDNAVIGDRWKLLVDPQGVEVLYDLENDPREQVPLPPVGPEADALRQWRDVVLAGGQ